MDLPFSAAQFFDVFARYNEAVWPAQIGLRALALLILPLLFVNNRAVDRSVMGILAFFWLWMAVVYHFGFFTAINPAAWLFGFLFLLQSLWIFWLGVVKGTVRFEVSRRWQSMAGGLLVLLALVIYPALSYFRGNHYPAVPSFGLPCPTTIYTLGILLLVRPPLPRSLFLVPLIWSAIGASAAYHLGVLQDLSLLLAGLVALFALFTREVRS